MSQDIKLLNMYPKNQDNFYSGVQPGKNITYTCYVTFKIVKFVPQKLRKIICRGTFTTYRFSVLHNYTWKIRKRTPKNDKTAMSGYRT